MTDYAGLLDEIKKSVVAAQRGYDCTHPHIVIANTASMRNQLDEDAGRH